MAMSKYAFAFVTTSHLNSITPRSIRNAVSPQCCQAQLQRSKFTPVPVQSRTQAFNLPRQYGVRTKNIKRSATPTASAATPSDTNSLVAFFCRVIAHAVSVGALIVLQSIVGAALKSMGITFPASLGAMLLTLTVVILLRILNLSKVVDRGINVIFNPAISILSRWLPVFFVPNLVMLPLAPALPSTDLTKIMAFVPIAFVVTLFSTASICCLLRKILPSKATASPVATTGIVSKASPPILPSNALLAALAIVMGITLYICVSSVAVTGFAARFYALSATLLTFSAAQRFPRALKMFFHPLIVCTAGTIGAMALLGAMTGTTFNVALSAYYVRSGTTWSGAGNMLSALLGPAVITFAFTVDRHRRLALARRTEVFAAALFTAIGSLFGTAFVARALGLASESRLLMVPRTVTAPLAMPIAALIGADVRLAASVVALTGLLGANIGRGLLTLFKIRDPVVRGLAMGASAHGLGTAAMSEEGEALPFAALAMTLVGIISTLFVAVTPFRALLLRLAVGGELIQAALL